VCACIFIEGGEEKERDTALVSAFKHALSTREIMLFIGKPIGKSLMISNDSYYTL